MRAVGILKLGELYRFVKVANIPFGYTLFAVLLLAFCLFYLILLLVLISVFFCGSVKIYLSFLSFCMLFCLYYLGLMWWCGLRLHGYKLRTTKSINPFTYFAQFLAFQSDLVIFVFIVWWFEVFCFG